MLLGKRAMPGSKKIQSSSKPGTEGNPQRNKTHDQTVSPESNLGNDQEGGVFAGKEIALSKPRRCVELRFFYYRMFTWYVNLY
jgi:hypothetical protein